jgi:hypothetical protein
MSEDSSNEREAAPTSSRARSIIELAIGMILIAGLFLGAFWVVSGN